MAEPEPRHRAPIAPPDPLEPGLHESTEPLDPEPPPPAETGETAAPARSRAPGRLALTCAVLMVLAIVAALIVDAPGRYLPATVLALVADALSLIAIVVGIVAIVRGRARGAGVAAVVIAVLGNPLVLLYGLGSIS